MIKKIKFFLVALLPTLFPQYASAQNWFPMDVGNRWDYFVIEDHPGGIIRYDTLSSLITDHQTLANGFEYYHFSNPIPILAYPTPKFFREENNKIFYYNEEDSSDCFAFRFDLPEDTFYTDCNGFELHIYEIDSSMTFGFPDIHQNQEFFYDFSLNFGIYHYLYPGIVECDYTLKGCIISGITYGYLLVSSEIENEIFKEFSVEQNYPNPFNPTTKIKYSIPSIVKGEMSNVTLKVYDVLGNEVATLVNEEKAPGTYEVEFNVNSDEGRNLSSGIYFYQLKAGGPEINSGQGFIETKKMVLLR